MTSPKRRFPATIRNVEWMREYIQQVASSLATLDYAIGGAVAQALYGYGRMSPDVDVFVTPEHAGAALHELKLHGWQVEVMAPHIHYSAYLPKYRHLYPEVRVDLLVASSDPEWSGATLSNEVDFDGTWVKVLPAELLALTRFYSSEPKHRGDLEQLLQRKLFDVSSATRILSRMDPESVRAWRSMVRELLQPPNPRPRPRRA